MKEITDSLLIAWRCAANEAVGTGYEVIEPQHLTIGLFRLQVFNDADRLAQAGFTPEEAKIALPEIRALMDLFQRHGLDPQATRRELRAEVAQTPPAGESPSPLGMHRSPQSRQMFIGAARLADKQGHEAVGPLHMLAALMDRDAWSYDALEARGVDPAQLSQEALENAGLAQPSPRRPESPEVEPSPLARFGTDLTQAAVDGRLTEAIGRKDEMLQIVRTLSRETKRNPLLIGDAGVGKTAIVEGLAWRIAQGNVPEGMRGMRIIQVNPADLVVGLELPGQYEARIQELMREANASKDVILFFDDFQGATGMLRIAFAGGDLQCMGACTHEAFRKNVESDSALERRFQPITIEEPGPEETLELLEVLRERLAKRHAVDIREDALKAAVDLSRRYIPDRHLPDKAIDLLDEACVRARITRLSTIPGVPVTEDKLVDAEVVAEVVSEWTGIPRAQLTEDEKQRLLHMAENLKLRVIGQDQAVDAVVQAVRRSRARIKDPDRPIAVLLFVGPTGVGKTELAKATAAFLFGSEQAMTRLDMSEYMSSISVSRLIGSPPGYVGYDKEGQLTGALRRKPFSVVLLDEIEKAHPDVLNLFLQVFDEGRLTDATGRTVDASSSIFIMTSNIAAARGIGFGGVGGRGARANLDAPLKAVFKPELVNRIDEVVPFRALDLDDLKRIARIMLDELGQRLAAQDLALEVTDSAVGWLAESGYDEAYGARPIRRAIEQAVENPLSSLIVSGDVGRGQVVKVDAAGGKIEIRSKKRRA